MSVSLRRKAVHAHPRSLTWAYAAILAAGLVMPYFIGGTYALQIACLSAIYVVISLGQNVVLGYSGQISLAQSALAAIGAYTSALLLMSGHLPFLLAASLAVAFTTMSGLLLGLLTMRVRTHYLLLVTIGFHIVVLLLIINLNDLTGGPTGLYPIPDIEMFGFTFRSQAAVWRLYLSVALVLLMVADRIKESRIGIALFAIKNNEKGARAAGIDAPYYRVLAMGIAAFYAGVGGVMFAFLIQFLGPESFSIHSALLYLLIVVVGGIGSNWGTVASAILLTLLSENLKGFAQNWVLLYGITIMIVVAAVPGGLAAIFARLRNAEKSALFGDHTP